MGGFGLKVGGKMAGNSKGGVGSLNPMFFLSFASRMQENCLNNEPTSAPPMHNVLYRQTVLYLFECGWVFTTLSLLPITPTYILSIQ